MRKLLVLVGLCVLFFATPALATVNLGLPGDTAVNFDGNGVFSQTKPFTFDDDGPLPQEKGSQLFGVGTISDIALESNLAQPIFEPDDAGVRMTFVFWNAVVDHSERAISDNVKATKDEPEDVFINTQYNDGARMLIVTHTNNGTISGGPELFNLQTGEFPGAFTIGEPGQEVFLDMSLSKNTSNITWSPVNGFTNGAFNSENVEILGGTGASQFADIPGKAQAFMFKFSPTGWAFGGDVDVQLQTVPEPATLIFLGTGLVSLIGYRLRRKMA